MFERLFLVGAVLLFSVGCQKGGAVPSSSSGYEVVQKPTPKWLEEPFFELIETPIKMGNVLPEYPVETIPILERSAWNQNPELKFGLRTDRNGYKYHFPYIVVDGTPANLDQSDELFGFSWRFIVSNDQGDRLFAILDHDIEGPAWSVELLVSEDSGRSWVHRARIKKPHYTAEIHTLGFDELGNGVLILHSEDYGQGNGGFYLYRSSGWGRSWEQPTLIPSTTTKVQN